ncbi:MAG TPA: NAD-dependent epimerase/dehydratase family protein [Syntrophorhabdaceae bacterium]|nr:NAD-dependent epimerase/dehydratase family protein [Syntrophorhabdaceae bacterium]
MNLLNDNDLKTIAVTGATGFIGTHLLDKLKNYKNVQIRALIHKDHLAGTFDTSSIAVIEGDLLDQGSLKHFPTRGSTVVNLVYLKGRSGEENLSAVDNLGAACAEAGIKRLIHCSTAVVVGRVPENIINEETKCNPINDYEIEKLEIEKLLIEKYSGLFEIVILRPTAVFGPGGRNLLKMADHISHGNRVINYVRSCLYNKRKMNLVSVENVVNALGFLISCKKIGINPEIFIISDDEDLSNEYRKIEISMLRSFRKKDYFIPVVPIPLFVLGSILKFSGRTNCNPLTVYSCSKLVGEGFIKKRPFQEGLIDFIDWYKVNS